MKTIAVPMAANGFSSHFGGAEAFALYTVDETTGVVADKRLVRPPEHGRGVFPVWLRQQGAEVVLAGGMGPRAVDIFTRQGVEVVLGVAGGAPDALVRDYLCGALVATGEACHEHGFHDCGHHGHEPRHGGQGGCREHGGA